MMNTYKEVVAIAINQEGFRYKYYNLNYAGNVFFYKILIFKVDGISCFILLTLVSKKQCGRCRLQIIR